MKVTRTNPDMLADWFGAIRDGHLQSISLSSFNSSEAIPCQFNLQSGRCDTALHII